MQVVQEDFALVAFAEYSFLIVNTFLLLTPRGELLN